MNRDEEKKEILSALQEDSRTQLMKRYIQHGKVSTFEHCTNVANCSYWIDKFFSAHSDLEVLLTGAMLHDFYLYDWHKHDNGEHRLHGFSHASTARENAQNSFGINEKTSHVIDSHMWPLNIGRLPRSKEAWIVCIADKLVSMKETLFRR